MTRTDCVTRGNVDASHTMGNHTAKIALAGCPRRIRTSLCRFRTDLLASFSRRSGMSGEEDQAPPDIRFSSKRGIDDRVGTTRRLFRRTVGCLLLPVLARSRSGLARVHPGWGTPETPVT